MSTHTKNTQLNKRNKPKQLKTIWLHFVRKQVGLIPQLLS